MNLRCGAPSQPSCSHPSGACRLGLQRRRPCTSRTPGRFPTASLGRETDAEPQTRIKQTMADLDALLGIEEPKQEAPGSTEVPEASGNATISIAPDVLRVMAEAEAKRAENAGTVSGPGAKKVNDSISRIVEQARKLAESTNANDKETTAGEQAMRNEFEQLLTVLTGSKSMDQEELTRLKKEVFEPQKFWVTETAPAPGFDGGIVFRGNFRAAKDVVFADVCKKVEQLYGDKYIVRLVEELEFEMMDPSAEPKAVFQILPADSVLPPPAPGWQRGAAFVVLLLTLGSAAQLGLAANVGLLPKETLQWLSNPDNLNTLGDVAPPGLENFDPGPFMRSAASVAGAALLPQLAHSLGHAVVAALKGIKTGPSFLIPNSQLATFGSITQLKSLARNRTDLFDFAAAGLLAGGAASLALFLAGAAASASGGGADAGLIPVPAQLFQGSLLLGGATKLALGGDALAKANVLVSPLLIGGWCGLVCTALNCLPVGNLDGGRAMLSAFGKSALGFASLLSYIGLGLGLLGSSLALPFGLYVLICQRESERNIQDEVSEVGAARQAMALGMLGFALLVLLPGVPDAADTLLLGPPSNFL